MNKTAASEAAARAIAGTAQRHQGAGALPGCGRRDSIPCHKPAGGVSWAFSIIDFIMESKSVFDFFCILNLFSLKPFSAI